MAENQHGTTHESEGAVPDHGSAGDSVVAVDGQDIDSGTDVRKQAEGCNKVDSLPGPGTDGEKNGQCAEDSYAGAKTIITGGDTNKNMTVAEDGGGNKARDDEQKDSDVNETETTLVQEDAQQETAANDKSSSVEDEQDQESQNKHGASAEFDGVFSRLHDGVAAEGESDNGMALKKSGIGAQVGNSDQPDGDQSSEAEMNQGDLYTVEEVEPSTDKVKTEKEWSSEKIPLSGDALLECSLVQADDTMTTIDTISSPVESTVTSVMVSLHGKLKFTELCENLMKLGQYLHLGTNAVADDATLLIMVQSALFDVVKLCDAVSLLMQNFKMSSNNIIEKLHVAFLYLLDGFPEFAKTDIECISKDVKSMQEQGLRCLKVVENLKIKIMTSEGNDMERNGIEENNRGNIKQSELWKKTVERIEDYLKYAGQPEWCDAFSELSNLSTRKGNIEKSEVLSSGGGHKDLNKNEMNVVQDTTSGTDDEKNLNDSTSRMDDGCKQPTASGSMAAVRAAQIDNHESSTVDRKLDAASNKVKAHGSCTADGMNGNKNGKSLSVDSLPVTNKTEELKSDSASEEVAENNGGKLVEHYGAATPDPAAGPTAEKKDTCRSKTGSTSWPIFKKIISKVQNIDNPSSPQAPKRWFESWRMPKEKTPGNSTLQPAGPDDASNAKMAKLPIKQIPSDDRQTEGPLTKQTDELKSESASEEGAEYDGGKLVFDEEHYDAATPDPAPRPTAEKKGDMPKTGITSIFPTVPNIMPIWSHAQRWYRYLREPKEKTPGNCTLQPAGPDDGQVTYHFIKQIPKVSDEKMEKAKQKRDSYHRVLLLRNVLELSIHSLGDIEDILKEANRLVDFWDAECKNVIEPWLVEGFGEADKLTQENQKQYWKSLWFQQSARDYYIRWCALGAFCDNHHSEVKRVRKEVDAYYTENLYPREAVKFAWRLAERRLIDNDVVKGLVEIEKRKHLME